MQFAAQASVVPAWTEELAQVIETPVRVAAGGDPVTVKARGEEVKLAPPAAVAFTVRFVLPADTPEISPELEMVAAAGVPLSHVPQVVP